MEPHLFGKHGEVDNSDSTRLPQIGEWNSTEELLCLQAQQLPRALDHARHSQFYRATLPNNGAVQEQPDLAQLPLTTKQHLREAYPFGLLATTKERLATYHESSGTSGKPTALYLTELDHMDCSGRFARNAIGLSATDMFMVKTPYSMQHTGHQAHLAGRLKGATIVPADHRSSNMPYARAMRLLQELHVTTVWCIPSDCLLWAAAAEHAGYKPTEDFPQLRGFLLAGEVLSRAKLSRIEETWNTKVFEDYGSTETGSLAGECPHGKLHLWADRFVPEIYDPQTGDSSLEGVGELTITLLYREAMPLIRYNLGDRVEISYLPCECGWHLPTINILGRTSEQLMVQGKNVSQAQVEDLVFRLPKSYGVMFWRARCTSSHLEVEIEVSPNNQSRACSELTTAISNQLQIPAEVVGVPPGTLVPADLLRDQETLGKPRYLLHEDEDWTQALLYYK